MEWNMKKGDFSQMGVVNGKNWVNFCFEGRKESDCKILLRERETPENMIEIPVPTEYGQGNLRAVRIYGIDMKQYDYIFQIDGKDVLDSYARRIVGREAWGDTKRLLPERERLFCRAEDDNFSWRGDRQVEIQRKDMVLYKLHMRGFTMGMSEDTPDRGTFKAFSKRIPYLKSLGITSVEFMPIYEFEEVELVEKHQPIAEYGRWKEKKTDKIKKPEKKYEYKINLWGYGEGMYFAPKASYAAGDCPSAELKECILQLHKKGMECIIEMHFPETVSAGKILDVLRYWVKEYHVDGFHLQGKRIPVELLVEDAYLGRTKLFCSGFSEDRIPEAEVNYPRLFVDTDEFFYPSRKLLNGSGGNIWELADQFRKQNKKIGYVNYIADNNGFTLADLFAYEYKHNEANGENNEDGLAWNYSCNCGVEGETTSRNVMKIRERKMKNAIAVLFLAQGVPMLMAGDEDCNTQKGNNNAYCQDNPIGWKNWESGRMVKDFLRYIKKMIQFRKEHPIIRREEPMELTDTLSCGYPDISYHEENAWISPQHMNRRALGILYCGSYSEKENDEDVYVGFNFSEFQKQLALPRQKKKKKWYLYMDTSVRNAFLNQPLEIKEDWYALEAQSVCIIISAGGEAEADCESPLDSEKKRQEQKK